METPDDELVDVYDDSLKKVGVVMRNEAHMKGVRYLAMRDLLGGLAKIIAGLLKSYSIGEEAFRELLEAED